MKRCKSFAIVPAAGASHRMGVAKLLLPYRGATIIEATLRAWRASGVARTVVVVRRGDAELAAAAEGETTDIIVPPVDPPQMKASVQLGLRHIDQHYRPHPEDAWLLAPADLPQLSAQVIDTVLNAYRPGSGRAVAPCAGDRRGHPVLFPWSLAAAVFALGPADGVDRLLDRVDVDWVTIPDPSSFDDVDHPQDYRRLSDA